MAPRWSCSHHGAVVRTVGRLLVAPLNDRPAAPTVRATTRRGSSAGLITLNRMENGAVPPTPGSSPVPIVHARRRPLAFLAAALVLVLAIVAGLL